MIKANVFVVGGRRVGGSALAQVAREAGFSLVAAYAGLDHVLQQAPRGPLNVFVFAEVPNPVVLSPVLAEIRGCGRRGVRFAPLVYCSESPSAKTVALCSVLGFDDIMTTPFAPKRLVERVAAQLDQPFDYLETPTYFGPARWPRPDMRQASGPDGRPLEPGRSFTFTRTEQAGVRILREEALSRPLDKSRAA